MTSSTPALLTALPTFHEIETHLNQFASRRDKSLQQLIDFDATENINRVDCGHLFIKSFTKIHSLSISTNNKPSLDEILMTPDTTQYQGMLRTVNNRLLTKKATNVIDETIHSYTFKNPVALYRPSTAKWFYKKYGATAVLDPTAGWGGRMLGAWSLGLPYTGIDTNIDLKPCYDEMINYLNPTAPINMIWKSCLDVDYSTIDYDCAFTSPPYLNIERYKHMPPFESKQAFYENFLLPLRTKLITHCRKGGIVAFNIYKYMYTDALTFGLPPADIIDSNTLMNSTGIKRRGLTNDRHCDMIYIWRC